MGLGALPILCLPVKPASSAEFDRCCSQTCFQMRVPRSPSPPLGTVTTHGPSADRVRPETANPGLQPQGLRTIFTYPGDAQDSLSALPPRRVAWHLTAPLGSWGIPCWPFCAKFLATPAPRLPLAGSEGRGGHAWHPHPAWLLGSRGQCMDLVVREPEPGLEVVFPAWVHLNQPTFGERSKRRVPEPPCCTVTCNTSAQHLGSLHGVPLWGEE